MTDEIAVRKQSARIIIVTGTPGTGKTTFSIGLAREIGADYISLTEFVSKHNLYGGFDRDRRSKIIDVEKTQTSLRSLLSHTQRVVVVDTHMPDRIIPREMARRVFVLRCHPRILEARLKAKRWNSKKIRENVLTEILDSCLIASVKYYDWRRVFQLDTSRNNVRACIASAKRNLSDRSARRRVKVDWLSSLDKEGLLDRYLK